LAVAALATPAGGAVNTTAALEDRQYDTTIQDSSNAPYGLDAADIRTSSATYKPSEITFTLQTTGKEKPGSTPNWGSPSTAVSWFIRTSSAAPDFDYEVRYRATTDPTPVITAKLYGASGVNFQKELPCSVTSATYSGQTYRATIDAACIGKPSTFTYGPAMTYKLDPTNQDPRVITDGSDNGTVSALLTKPKLGYWLVGRDGGIFAFGDAGFSGSTGAMKLNQPIVGMANDPDGKGYWFVAADGGIFAFDAPFFGSTGAMKLNKPIVGMAATPTGQGYYLVASDGGIFSFGDAKFRGSTGNIKLNKPIVGMAAAHNNRGYWLVASDGGIFNFGNGAEFFGSSGALKLSQPIVGMAAAPNNRGYWFVAADGGIFNYGEGADFFGSKLGGSPVTGIVAAPDGRGYWVTRASGEVNGFGSVPSLGSLTQAPASPIVGIAALDLPDPAAPAPAP
jgi:hypothetical protein